MKKRILSLFAALLFLLPLLASSPIHGADATSFDPTRVEVKAKGSGGVPVGMILAWPVGQNPEDMDNWLECNGQSISPSVYPELFAVLGGQVPDLRGVFLRGLDNGKGIDPGREIGTYQADEVGPHTHPVNLWRHNAGGGGIWSYPKYDGYDGTIWTRPNSGVETRPKNHSVRYLIRARP